MQRPASCEKSYHVQSKSRTAFITCQNITNKRQENNMVANQERVAKKRAKIFPNLGQCPRNNVSKGLITWRVFSPVDRPENLFDYMDNFSRGLIPAGFNACMYDACA